MHMHTIALLSDLTYTDAMQDNKENSIALALGISLATAASLGIYLAYHFGHGNSLHYWAVLLGTGVLSFGLSLVVFIVRRHNAGE